MILHNRSFETDCCDCCKDDSFARIPRPIMDSINNGIRSTDTTTYYDKHIYQKPIILIDDIVMSDTIENVLILQGGGSLGAFGCGVFKALA